MSDESPTPFGFSNTHFHRALWDRSPVGCAVVSRDGRFLEANAAYSLLTGYSITELRDLTFQEITHPNDLAADVSEADYLAEHPSSGGYTLVKRYLRKDNRTVWVELHVSALCLQPGVFNSYLVYAVPLPNAGGYRIEAKDAGVVVRPTTRWVDLFRDNPRETALIFAVLIGVAKGHDLWSLLMEFLKVGK